MPRVSTPAAILVGSHISRIRKSRSMTVDHLAVAGGIDSSNVRSYEAGRAMMNLGSLVRIAEALEVSPGDLLEGVSSELFTNAK